MIALLFLLLSTTPAAADPVTIGTLIVGAEIGGTTIVGSVTVGSVVGYAALTAASIALSITASYLLAKSPGQSTPQDGQITTRQSTPPRRRSYGRVKIGGAVIFSEVGTIGSQSTRCQVTALNEGEIDAFEEHWLADHHSFFAGGDSGLVVTGEYHLGGTAFVALDTRKGLATETAFGQLLTTFPTMWGASYRGDGIASALVTAAQPPNFADFTTVYPGGVPPVYRAVIRAVKIWDPRAGGQDKDTPSTWAWSDNPVLIALDYHRHGDGMGLSVFDATLFTSAALTQDWIPAANICDEIVGGEKRYRCSGGYELPNDRPADVLAAAFSACDGQTYQRADGAIGIRVGKTIAPTVTLDDRHIIGYSGLVKGDNVFLACNEVTAKYISPDHDYQETDADPWRDEADITARAQVLTKAISLLWVNSHTQVRRLTKLAHARFNPEWRGSIVTDMAGLAALNERFIHVTISEGGLSLVDGSFEITSFEAKVGDQAVICTIGIASLDQSAFDWDPGTEAGTPPPIPAVR